VKRTLAIAFLFLSSCGMVQQNYVLADGATYDAIAPEYRAYVEADTRLDAEQKARRIRTIESWLLRVTTELGK